MRVWLGNHRWDFVNGRPTLEGKSVDGLTIEGRQRRITIDSSIEGRQRLETIIHEALHACCPHTTEDAIEKHARQIASLLWRLGYRA